MDVNTKWGDWDQAMQRFERMGLDEDKARRWCTVAADLAQLNGCGFDEAVECLGQLLR